MTSPKNPFNDIFKSFKPFLEKVDEILKPFQPIVKNLEAITPQFVRLAEGLQRWHEKSQELAVALEKDDVFLIPFFGDLETIYKLADRIKTENITMLEIYDEFFSEKENVVKLLDSWMDNPFFKERRTILERCLLAHSEKDFIFTVPIFYIHIEKYCKNLLDIQRNLPAPVWKKKLEEVYKSENEAEDISKFISDGYAVKVLTKQIFEHFPKYQKLADPNYPNRHEVLHGDDLNYFNKKHASLRCILLLDILSDFEKKDINNEKSEEPV